MKKQSKVIIGSVVGVLLVAVVVIMAVLIASGSDSRNYAKHMESAQRYMDELQYEQAIAEYKAAIEIDPNNVEAYQALAELYVQTGDYESAVAVLDQGMEQTGSEELSGYIEEVQAAYGDQKVFGEVLQKVQQESVHEEKEEDLHNSATENQSSNGIGMGQDSLNSKTKVSVDLYARNWNIVKELYYSSVQALRGYYIYDYDENGIIVKKTHYNAYGTMSNYYSIYDYDENGIIVKETCYNAAGGYDGYIHGVYEYDRNGVIVKGTRYSQDGRLRDYYIYDYDANGNCVKRTPYYADGTMSGYYSIYNYDANGHIVQEIGYYADETLAVINEYDANGDHVKSEHYANGTLSGSFSWEYDVNGNCVKGERYENGALLEYDTWEYDANGNCVKHTNYRADGTVALVWEYNTNGKCIKYAEYHRDGTIFIRENDANGNTIKETEYNADGTLYRYWLIEYDESGKRKVVEYSADGTVMEEREY